MFVKELRELLEVLGRIAAALEQLADDSLARRNAAGGTLLRPEDRGRPVQPARRN